MNHQENYEQFLQQKAITDPATGLSEIPELNTQLFDFQHDIVSWALRRGRAAIFADCGMGKTPMQLEWAKHIPGRVLILAPLAVAQQTVREGAKFGIDVQYRREGGSDLGKITIANYEMLEHFDASQFQGVVLDESSILKSYMGKTKRTILESFANTPYKLACTATPAPNDYMELGNHAEFLGVMKSNEMLMRWFINDTMNAGQYRLKGHGEADFWRWVASWAVALSKTSDVGDYDDTGYELPPLNVRVVTVGSLPPEGYLFHTGATLSATEIHKAKRSSAQDRAAAVVNFAKELPNEKCLIWCDANYEADAVTAIMPEAVDVRGSDSTEKKEAALNDFANGNIKDLVTKPSIAGFGMNFQECHRVAFVGLSYSFENEYQAIRRVWRFGQKYPVECLIVESEAESGIRGVVERKIADHKRMQESMIKHMREWQKGDIKMLKDAPEPECKSGEGWTVWLGDCVEVLKTKVADSSIDFSIFSPPFSNLYIYSDSNADMGNSADHDEFFQHMKFMIKDLYRATVNGRLCAIHVKDLPSYKGRDGAAGLIDFPGMCIRAFEECGWQYHSRVTIWKDPVTEMQR
jgi:superfamily II DNA or RNA helicase